MMNLAASPAHRTLGMPGPTALNPSPFNTVATSALHPHHPHQRSAAFGIQELLGLGQHTAAVSMLQDSATAAVAAVAAARLPNPHHHHHHLNQAAPQPPTAPPPPPAAHHTTISASSYIPRTTVQPPPSTASSSDPVTHPHHHPGACFPPTSWRNNFMAAAFPGSHPQHHMFNLTTSPGSFSQAHLDTPSGWCYMVFV